MLIAVGVVCKLMEQRYHSEFELIFFSILLCGLVVLVTGIFMRSNSFKVLSLLLYAIALFIFPFGTFVGVVGFLLTHSTLYGPDRFTNAEIVAEYRARK